MRLVCRKDKSDGDRCRTFSRVHKQLRSWSTNWFSSSHHRFTLWQPITRPSHTARRSVLRQNPGWAACKRDGVFNVWKLKIMYCRPSWNSNPAVNRISFVVIRLVAPSAQHVATGATDVFDCLRHVSAWRRHYCRTQDGIQPVQNRSHHSDADDCRNPVEIRPRTGIGFIISTSEELISQSILDKYADKC